MPDIDFFNFFRYTLGTIVTIYATIVTLQSLWGWYVFLSGRHKYISLVRRYVIVHGLRLRFKTFWGDVIICGLLSAVFIILLHAHSLIHQMGDTMTSMREASDPRPMPAKVIHVTSHA